MRKIYSTFVLFILTTNSFGQIYTEINQVAIQQNFTAVQQNTFINNNAGLFSIANALISFRNAWKDEKIRERGLRRTQSQLNIAKNLYEGRTSFPKKIIDGWHSVKITDFFNYCSDAKVFVKNNLIKNIVIHNYLALSLNYSTISAINDAKSTVNLKLPNGNTDTVIIYFLYDLEQPRLTSEPLHPGFVTFWSDLGNTDTIEIWIEDEYQGKLKAEMENAECFAPEGLTLKLKPGTYFFESESRGAKSWSGLIEIKENKCLTYMLNKENKE